MPRSCLATALLALGMLVGSPGAMAAGDPDALRKIVQRQCVVHWLQSASAAPCDSVYLPPSRDLDSGYAVLKDRKGGAHFLIISTRAIGGMESPELLKPGVPNYFAAAWRERGRIAAVIGHPVPRDAVGLAINPKHARTQDQFHIHLECLRADVAAALHRIAVRLGDQWAPMRIGGTTYQAIRIRGEALGEVDPIRVLAERLPAARESMGDYTLVLAGISFADGPGFVELAGTGPAGELLLDSTCAMVRRR